MEFETFIQQPKKELAAIEDEIGRLRARFKHLKEKRDQLVIVIQYNVAQLQKRHKGAGVSESGAYAGLKIVDSVVSALETTQKAMNSRELTEVLLAGGFETESKTPRKYVYIALRREALKEEPRVVKQKNKFGLPSWPEDDERWNGKVPSLVRRRRRRVDVGPP